MNIVNRTFARAAEQQQPKLRAHLKTVIRGEWPQKTDKDLGEMVDEMAIFMGRHVSPLEKHKT